MTRQPTRYVQLLEHVFRSNYRPGAATVEFARTDLEIAASQLGVTLPKNLGDVVYSARYRTELPQWMRDLAPGGLVWIIEGAGRSMYRFRAVAIANFEPSRSLRAIVIPDATPGLIEMYAFTDEQALLAKLRYNRLIDTFLDLTCYSLQNHLRTTVRGVGQVETDEIYVGLNREGRRYVVPVQAKGGRDRSSTVQISQDFRLCEAKFPDAICIPVAAQFMVNDVIALFAFEEREEQVHILRERHYRLGRGGLLRQAVDGGSDGSEHLSLL